VKRQLGPNVRRVVLGPPPPPSAAVADKLRFLRDVWVRIVVLLTVALVWGLVAGAPVALWIVLGVAWAAWLVGALKLWADLRRERRRGGMPS
jgi:hypothetical protein